MTVYRFMASSLHRRVREMREAIERGEMIEALPFLAVLDDLVDEINQLWEAVENPLVITKKDDAE